MTGEPNQNPTTIDPKSGAITTNLRESRPATTGRGKKLPKKGHAFAKEYIYCGA